MTGEIKQRHDFTKKCKYFTQNTVIKLERVNKVHIN